MPTARKRRATQRRAAHAPRATARTAVAAALGVTPRLGARTEFRIYPSIAIARVGDCEDEFIIGPEAPGVVPSGPFRGADHGLKPQAARFRIYKVEIDANENETVSGEIVPGSNVQIEWSVSLANRKAAGLRIGDTLARRPNPRPAIPVSIASSSLLRQTVRSPARGRRGRCFQAASSLQGRARAVRRLRILCLRSFEPMRKGGCSWSAGPASRGRPSTLRAKLFSDNDGWYDSVSDGPVWATFRIGGQAQPVVPAWVVITVPRYAPGIYGIVTWYDQAVNMARMTTDGRFNRPATTSFTHDIYPILKRADDLSAVHGVAHCEWGDRRSSELHGSLLQRSGQRGRTARRLTPSSSDAAR